MSAPTASQESVKQERRTPQILRGKPLRRIQREIYQRLYRYPHRQLLIIGQPKSGSTWLYRMVQEAPGYVPFALSGLKIANRHALRREHLIPPPAGYTVSKSHSHPTDENLAIIHEAGRPYVVLIRDPRDLIVSWAYYVALPGRTEWRYEEARHLPVPQRIDFYIERGLNETLDWAVNWQRRIDPELGLLVRYEDLLKEPKGVMQRVFNHFEVHLSEATVSRIVEMHTFEKATGRKPGEADPKQFNRKGIAGDWQNHFTSSQREAFKRVAEGRLIELGYERDDAW